MDDAWAIERATPYTILAAKEAPPAERGVWTWEKIQQLVDWATTNPQAWRVLTFRLACPGATQNELAESLGLHQSTVSRALAAVRELHES
jgi:hypothetical protein